MQCKDMFKTFKTICVALVSEQAIISKQVSNIIILAAADTADRSEIELHSVILSQTTDVVI